MEELVHIECSWPWICTTSKYRFIIAKTNTFIVCSPANQSRLINDYPYIIEILQCAPAAHRYISDIIKTCEADVVQLK